MNIKYLIRLDDACPTMSAKRWGNIEQILDEYGIKPLVGVIPDNRDVAQQKDNPDLHFWEKVRTWQKKGWAIAMHGCDHVYSSRSGGMNPVQLRSEFAGLSLREQENKILKGREILLKQGINPAYFFAPSHTFDKNTLKALRNKSEIRIISDTPAFYPYLRNGFTFIPVQFGCFRKIRFSGVWTFCFHPNLMTEKEMNIFKSFIHQNQSLFGAFDEIKTGDLFGRSVMDRCFAFGYYMYRKLKNWL